MNKKDQIDLVSGRVIYLKHLKQYRIYGGLLEGYPTAEMNQRTIDHLLKSEQENTWNKATPYLVPPTYTYRALAGDNPAGEYVALPPIVCIANFHSSEPARDPQQDFSDLKIIWFQHDWAFPIDEAVLEQIKQIDWNQYAVDDVW